MSLLGGLFGSARSKQSKQKADSDIYDAISAAQSHKAFVTRAGEVPKAYANVFKPYGDPRPSPAQRHAEELKQGLNQRYSNASRYVNKKIASTRAKFKDPDPLGRTSLEGTETQKTQFKPQSSVWS